MNGRTSRKLRAIARELKLSPITKYVPAGPLRRRPSHLGADGNLQLGDVLPRSAVLTECYRRAYKEAKKLYKGKPVTMLVPEDDTTKEKSYAVRIVDSLKAYVAQN